LKSRFLNEKPETQGKPPFWRDSKQKMIRKIRKQHKIVWLILAVLLPLLFIASIAFRHSEPINENIPKIERSEKK
jgi:hypothetical protein